MFLIRKDTMLGNGMKFEDTKLGIFYLNYFYNRGGDGVYFRFFCAPIFWVLLSNLVYLWLVLNDLQKIFHFTFLARV